MIHTEEDNFLPLESDMIEPNNGPSNPQDSDLTQHHHHHHHHQQQQHIADLINNNTSIDGILSNRRHDLNTNKDNTNNGNNTHQHNSTSSITTNINYQNASIITDINTPIPKAPNSITNLSETALNNSTNNNTHNINNQSNIQTTTLEPDTQSIELYILNELNNNNNNHNSNNHDNNNNNSNGTANVKNDNKFTSQFTTGTEAFPPFIDAINSATNNNNNNNNISLSPGISKNLTNQEGHVDGSQTTTKQIPQQLQPQHRKETSPGINSTSLQTAEVIVDDLPFINGLDTPLDQPDNNNNNNNSDNHTNNLNNDTNTSTNTNADEDPYSNEQPYYVNAKQYYRILKRRYARAKLEERLRISRERKPYLHESRHKHAMRRPRGQGGRFLTAAEIKALKEKEAKEKAAQDAKEDSEMKSTNKDANTDNTDSNKNNSRNNNTNKQNNTVSTNSNISIPDAIKIKSEPTIDKIGINTTASPVNK